MNLEERRGENREKEERQEKKKKKTDVKSLPCLNRFITGATKTKQFRRPPVATLAGEALREALATKQHKQKGNCAPTWEPSEGYF